jgi:hypothetical protein
MGLHLSRTLRGMFARPKAVAPSDAPFDTEAAIARYLAQRERSVELSNPSSR